MKKGVSVWCMVVVMVALLATVHETAAVNCDPLQLSACLGAITGGQDPSQQCCTNLKEQEPCFCSYINNPIFKRYIDSPNAIKVASSCDVSIPTVC